MTKSFFINEFRSRNEFEMTHTFPRPLRERVRVWGKNAFTLAEILITLGIIGVVAAMTITTLVANYQEKSWSTTASVFERKLTEALRVMNTQQTLAGYTTTEDFVNELKKHIKIIKTCDNTKLDNCFPKTFTYGFPETETMDITTFTDSSKLRKEPYGTNTVGIQFANGVAGVLAYDPNCKQDPYSNTVTGMGCISMIYDTSGNKSPNTSNKDLRLLNVNKLYAFKIGGTKFGAPFKPTAITKVECEQLKADGYGITACNYNNDYWAGAVKACGGTSKMASMEDLGKIAAYVYNQESVGAKQDISSGLTFDATKAAELGLPSPIFSLWSGEETSSDNAYFRDFYSTYTGWYYHYRYTSVRLAVCVE